MFLLTKLGFKICSCFLIIYYTLIPRGFIADPYNLKFRTKRYSHPNPYKQCHLPLNSVSQVLSKNKLIDSNINILNEIRNLLIDADFIILLIHLLLLIPFFLFCCRQNINLFNGIFKEVRFVISKRLAKTKIHFKIPIT